MLPLYLVDAFTDRPFAGNPAAVCFLDQPQAAKWMQAVAAELNLSETAFVTPSPAAFDLRWFTPTTEVDLCGHATLASAHCLWEAGLLAPDAPARFDTRSGRLTATRHEEWITLDFPATPVTAAPPPAGLVEALGVTPVFTGRSVFDVFAVLERAEQVRRLRPDLAGIARIPARGLIVTAAADEPGVDFVSRFFAPAVGIPEDPVTGSAHCALAPYWAQRLGRNRLVGYQVSARGGTVRTALRGDRVLLSGQAVTVIQGEIVAGTPAA
jgi:PhzF family phenazine biosynthesis protein